MILAILLLIDILIALLVIAFAKMAYKDFDKVRRKDEQE
jgi:hypothetical protein